MAQDYSFREHLLEPEAEAHLLHLWTTIVLEGLHWRIFAVDACEAWYINGSHEVNSYWTLSYLLGFNFVLKFILSIVFVRMSTGIDIEESTEC